MRTSLALVACALVPTLVTGQPLRLDVPVTSSLLITNPRVLPPCDLGLVVSQLGRALNTPVGFENSRECELSWRGRPDPTSPDTEDLKGMSPRQAFDYLTTFMPAFSWREMDGVIVVRPKAAWDDPQNVLHGRTAPFEATNQPLRDVLHTLLAGVTPNVSVPHTDLAKPSPLIDRPVAVSFGGGTMLDAVNEVVRVRGGLYWQLAYDATPYGATIDVGMFDLRSIVLEPVALPPAQHKTHLDERSRREIP